MAADISRYDTYEECRDTLLRMGYNEKDLLFCLRHEKAHFEKAKALGYDPVYGVRMIPDCPPVVLTWFVDFRGKEPTDDDLIAILLAPENPGEDDINLAQKLQSKTPPVKRDS